MRLFITFAEFKAFRSVNIIRWMAPALVGAFVGMAGCATAPQLPTEVNVTPMQEFTRPAKGPDCDMPILYAEPTREFQKIAIVEGWGNINDTRDKVLQQVRRKACETGADALLVLEGGSQKNKKLVYGVTPNRGTEETSSGFQNNPDNYLSEQERIPGIGEVGHPGTYVDAVAIVWGASAGTTQSN